MFTVADSHCNCSHWSLFMFFAALSKAADFGGGKFINLRVKWKGKRDL